MADRPEGTIQPSLLDRLAEARVLRHWRRAGAAAPAADLGTLRAQRGRARRLRRELDRVIDVAEGRLALPAVGSNAMSRPPGADWLWRPDPWRFPIAPRGQAGAGMRTPVCPGMSLFHDCPMAEITVRQDRNARPGDLAPFGLAIETFGFAGRFLSLAIDLPEDAIRGLSARHVIRVEAEVECERPTGLLFRLNLRQGPNAEQILAHVAEAGRNAVAEFDLAYGNLRAAPIDKLWLDLMIDRPAMNAVRLRDLRFSRRPRAEL
ncbi:MAG: DUF6478 family protein [Rhodobacteraceae bacterium]|nr:DUF6478 family protein [Paracoccaceae bacterium]